MVRTPWPNSPKASPRACATASSPWGWRGSRRRSLHNIAVVPANAETHTPRRILLRRDGRRLSSKQLLPVVMGPGLRGDDSGVCGARREQLTASDALFLRPRRREDGRPARDLGADEPVEGSRVALGL